MLIITHVAPRAGAWIETENLSAFCPPQKVAPRAGAWIETNYLYPQPCLLWSPLAQGRGLKLFIYNIYYNCTEVAPRAGAWIETDSLNYRWKK